MTETRIDLTVNGRDVSAEIEPRLHLADFVREELLLTATHLGCEQGVCGACTVMKDGRPVRGCLTLAVSCQGAQISTLEAFEDDALMNTLRAAFKQYHGLQCGFCTPGMLATAYDLVRRLPDADEARIRKEISGNLCRCTGYQGAVNAIKHVLANDPPAPGLAVQERSRPKATEAMATGLADNAPQTASRVPAEQAQLSLPESIEDGVNITRTIRLAAPAERLERLLRDVSVVATCIPGAELTSSGDSDPLCGFIGVAIGPMAARFDGVARVRYRDDATGGSIIGRGQDRLTRSQLDGALDYTLRALNDAETELQLHITYRLVGFLAQVGRPAIIEQIADRLLDETASRLAARATGAENTAAPQKPVNGLALLFASLRGLLAGILGRRS